MTTELLNKDGSPMREHESPIIKKLLAESEAEKKSRESGLNPLELKTGSAYLEYILNSEHELLWMHFDEAQRIESAGKDEAFDEGFSTGVKETTSLLKMEINRILSRLEKLNLSLQNEQ
jgi:hypothetical protein